MLPCTAVMSSSSSGSGGGACGGFEFGLRRVVVEDQEGRLALVHVSDRACVFGVKVVVVGGGGGGGVCVGGWWWS
jgi:hypothetical protein